MNFQKWGVTQNVGGGVFLKWGGGVVTPLRTMNILDIKNGKLPLSS